MIDIDLEDEIDSLVRQGRNQEAEGLMLKKKAESIKAGDNGKLIEIVRHLARFYATPGTDNLAKAEGCFLELEQLSPGSYSKYQTAMFYFYSLQDYGRVISKSEEFEPNNFDSATRYSMLALTGLASIKLHQVDRIGKVLDDLLYLLNSDPDKLPYGDEINLLDAAGSIDEFKSKSRQLLEMVVPRIRDREFKRRGNRLLKALTGKAAGGQPTS